MTRRFLAILILTTALAAPGTASAADDPLLSGYGGPGGGDQSSLGGELLPAPSGDRSLRAPSPRGAAATKATGTAPAVGQSATGSAQDGATAAGRPQAGTGAAGSGKAATDGRRGEGPATSPRDRASGREATPAESTAARPARAQPVAYPATDAAGALPSSGGLDAPLLLLGLVALLLVGAMTWGLARRPGIAERGASL